MREHLLEASPTSEVSIEVYGDDQLIVADPDLPMLVTDDRQWIATVMALVAELRSGPFTHPSEQSIRQILERLRTVRVVRADSVRLVLGGEEIEPPAQTTSLPSEDGVAPTIVAWPRAISVFEDLEQCAGSMASLVGQPQLADALQLVFSRLAQACPLPFAAITDTVLAQALQVSKEQVRESRAELRGPLFDILDRLRVLICYFAGTEEVAAFDLRAADAADENGVITALESSTDLLPMSPAELVRLCRTHTGLADLRDALGLEFIGFNETLAKLEPPHPPLLHPDRHEQAMARFVEAHEEAILARLREAYPPQALEGGDLTAYGEGRSHEGLVPDPEWFDRFAEPPEELLAQQVGNWLTGHGANADLDRPQELPAGPPLAYQLHGGRSAGSRWLFVRGRSAE